VHLADRVEVEVRCRVQSGQQFRHPPARAGERRGEHLPLRPDVAVVIADLGRDEEELRDRLVAGAEHARGPAGLAVEQPRVLESERVGDAVDRHVHAQVAHDVLVRAEGQPADGGVHAVGADDQVEPARARVLERDPDPVGMFVEARDRVAEHVLGAVPGRLVQDPAEVAAQDLHVAGEDLGRHGRDRPAVAIDVGRAAQVGLPRPDLVQDAHLGQHVQVDGAAEVDGVAAVAQTGRAFDDGGAEPVPVEPVGERGTGDARAGDQDVHDQNHTHV
jgi:hypothetical protein